MRNLNRQMLLPAEMVTLFSFYSLTPAPNLWKIKKRKKKESVGNLNRQVSLPAEMVPFFPFYSSPKPLEGTWNFPQVPDSISLDSSTGDDDTDTGDMDSILSSSLPDADLSLFDPLRPDTAAVEDAEGAAGMLVFASFCLISGMHWFWCLFFYCEGGKDPF